MELITINKSNWSGESANIKCFTNAVKLYGILGAEKWETFSFHKVNTDIWEVRNHEWNQPICYINLENGYYKAYNGYCERDAKSKGEAVAKLLYNIL